MDITTVYAPAPRTEFVELARTRKGRLFRKQILHFGEFAHPTLPGEKLVINASVAEKLVQNFRNGVCDIVQVPIVADDNRHVEDPLRNLGEVVDLEQTDDGVYAVIDARDHADKLGNTLIGASAMMHMNYTDTRSGAKVGPTLLHVAVTNRPYITNLKDYEEIIAASAEVTGSAPVAFSAQEQETDMDLDELKSALLEHGIDVDALQARATAPTSDDLVAAMSNVLAEAGVIQPKDAEDAEITVQDVAEAVIELSQEKVTLSAQITELLEEREALRLSALEDEVDDLISEGRILPKQRDAMIKLANEDRETFDALLPEDSIVALSAVGVDTHDAPDRSTKFQADIDRLADMANQTTKK